MFIKKVNKTDIFYQGIPILNSGGLNLDSGCLILA